MYRQEKRIVTNKTDHHFTEAQSNMKMNHNDKKLRKRVNVPSTTLVHYQQLL